MRLIPFLAARSLRRHALATMLTAVLLALASGLTMSVLVLRGEIERAMTSERLGFDAVLGARGSELQLVLNAVFHLETSPGNIPWSLYEQVRALPAVDLAVPYALGDNYRGHRIVGTTSELFKRARFDDGGAFRVRPGGRLFDPERREAIVGSIAARRLGLGVGDVFQPYHGLAFDPAHQHSERYVVTGILEPTGSPADRLLWIPIEGVFRMEGHVLRGAEEEFVPRPGLEIPDEHKEVSAVLIRLTSPQAGFQLAYQVNRQGNVATLAFPIGAVMADFFRRMDWGYRVLELVALMLVAVGAGTVLVALYNTIRERRREFAILRAVGVRRRSLFGLLVSEAAAIAAIGAAGGLLVYVGLGFGVAYLLRTQVGLDIRVLAPHPPLAYVPAGLVLLGALSGILPAWQAYRTDVSESLQPFGS